MPLTKGPIGQHKEYAETGKINAAEDFGAQPHNHRDGGVNHNDGSHRKGGRLRDHECGVRPGIKYHSKRMPTQAAPDHGDHL